MTLAVGIERRGRIWIGADSAIKQGDYVAIAFEPKVWRAGEWMVSGSGPWRALNVVRLAAKLPRLPRPSDADKCVELDVIGAITRALEQAGVRHDIADDDEGETECSWLIGAQGLGLWKIADQTAQRTNEAVIGCEEYADGWLDASPFANPELRIRECIKAASKRLPANVRLPVRIIGPDAKAA